MIILHWIQAHLVQIVVFIVAIGLLGIALVWSWFQFEQALELNEYYDEVDRNPGAHI